jgi:hypothetical protein
MSGIEIARQAREQLVELTGLTPDTISAIVKGEDGFWRVAVELVEMKRCPNTSDLLATYEAFLDDDATLLRYQRTRRYLRGQTMEEEA